jgi:ribulose 1,5-bisphosphate synthetase/thiazole synthase
MDAKNDIPDLDVIVIGGGAAGLKCASKLCSNGVKNILVLEAQDYLGGR